METKHPTLASILAALAKNTGLHPVVTKFYITEATGTKAAEVAMLTTTGFNAGTIKLAVYKPGGPWEMGGLTHAEWDDFKKGMDPNTPAEYPATMPVPYNPA